MRLEVNEECPTCHVGAGMPRDGENEDVFPCAECGARLVIKAAIFEDPVRVWLVTLVSEKEAAIARKGTS